MLKVPLINISNGNQSYLQILNLQHNDTESREDASAIGTIIVAMIGVQAVLSLILVQLDVSDRQLIVHTRHVSRSIPRPVRYSQGSMASAYPGRPELADLFEMK